MAMEVLQELLPMGKLFLTWDIPKSHTITGEPVVEVENFLTSHLKKVKECHLHGQKPGKYSHDIIGGGKNRFFPLSRNAGASRCSLHPRNPAQRKCIEKSENTGRNA